MNNPLISIIIPSYNCASTLERAALSAVNQIYQNIEVIIVNDGSTDNRTPSLCEELAARYACVRTVHRENGGQSAARGSGLSASKGDYIVFLDADDSLQPEMCQVAISAINSDTDFVLYGFNVYNQGKLLRTPNPGDAVYANNNYKVYNEHIKKLMASACNKFYKRNYIKVGFNTSFVHGEDINFNMNNFCRDAKVKTIHNCLYNVNLDNPTSINKSYKKGRLCDCVTNLQLIESKLQDVFDLNSEQLKEIQQESVDRIISEIYMLCSIKGRKFLEDELSDKNLYAAILALLNRQLKPGRKALLPVYTLFKQKQLAALSWYCELIVLAKRIKRK